ncbi:MAG: hypothetical protein QXI93_03555 [Candidatus Methanomethylicia archaeon]
MVWFFLVGAATADHDALFQKIELEYEKSDPYVKAAFIKAARILRTKKPNIEIPRRMLDLITAAVNDQYQVVRAEAITACITFFDINPTSFGGLLLELTQKR